jgi:hypothetical protein
MNKYLKHVNHQATAVIQPLITHVVSHKVGAIHLRRVNSQYDLMGALHCDYHDNINKKVPDEEPQSILLALDPFNLLYESNMSTGGLMDGKVNELLVNWEHAVVFSSSFCHAGGSNYNINKTGYVYCLFAYIVLAEADYSLNKGQTLKRNIFDCHSEYMLKQNNVVNSLTAIDGHDRQYFNELRSTVVSHRIFIRSQSLIAC